MPPRKRKANSKHQDEAPVKRAKTKNEAPTKRASVPRAAKAKRSDPEWLVTNEESPVVNEDLHAELCNPQTYDGYTKEDWDDLRSTLPENVPVNPDGYSIPIDFFKYNPDFRRGIREFQEDLAAGRLEPEWQAAAAEAMEERARGDFDAYKENQYEEFWGQKQKIDWSIPAGESTTLKLDMMIKNGVFRAGDEIVFTRAIGRKEKRVLLEKECKVVGVGVRSMTLAIPLGRFKYPCQQTALEASTLPEPQVQGGEDTEDRSGTTAPNAYPQEIRPLASNDARVDQIAANEPEGNTDLEKLGPDADQAPTRKEFNDETLVVCSNGVSNSPKKETLKTPSKNTILYEINNLKQLMDKIIEIDGRLNPKDLKEVPAISPWKCMRVRRDNQDLGTLFEMRDDFYAYKLPHITKASKK